MHRVGEEKEVNPRSAAFSAGDVHFDSKFIYGMLTYHASTFYIRHCTAGQTVLLRKLHAI